MITKRFLAMIPIYLIASSALAQHEDVWEDITETEFNTREREQEEAVEQAQDEFQDAQQDYHDALDDFRLAAWVRSNAWDKLWSEIRRCAGQWDNDCDRRVDAAETEWSTAEGDSIRATPHAGFTHGVAAIPVRSSAFPSDTLAEAEIHLLRGDGRVGIENAPADGYRWGYLRDSRSWMGGRTAGAFGNRAESASAWLGRTATFELTDVWRATLSGTLAVGDVWLAAGTMLDVEAHILSTWEAAFERRADDTRMRFALSQPARAETGAGTLTYMAGLKHGQPFYETASVPLSPERREVRLTLAHERPLGPGRLAAELSFAENFGHRAGMTDARGGVAWRMLLR
ncbi:MAG: hypothetical protein F4053_08650 [Proteobacteria bacterium]|nr:hypothetical protein [Pseudomonadota bacterium]